MIIPTMKPRGRKKIEAIRAYFTAMLPAGKTELHKFEVKPFDLGGCWVYVHTLDFAETLTTQGGSFFVRTGGGLEIWDVYDTGKDEPRKDIACRYLGSLGGGTIQSRTLGDKGKRVPATKQ